MRPLNLQNVSILLQDVEVITKWDIYYTKDIGVHMRGYS